MTDADSERPPWSGVALVNQQVTTSAGQVTAYTVQAMLPTQRSAPAAEDIEATLDAAYDATDLSTMSAGQPLLVAATRRTLKAPDPRVVPNVPLWLAREPGVEGVIAWRHARGLSTALDGFVADPAQLPLLPMAGLVSIDLTAAAHRLGELVDTAHAVGARVIGTGAATDTQARAAFAIGVDLVQGRFVAEGELERGGLSAGQLQCVEMLRLLSEDPIDQNAVVGLVAADPNLTVGVLHLVNSAVFALNRPVDSVRQAVVLVGPRLLRAVATSALNGAGRTGVDDLWQALTRALTCWELSADDAGYTVGLLSAVAEQRAVDLPWLAEMAGLSEAATAALTRHEGLVGTALACVQGHEAGDPSAALHRGVDPHLVSQAWLQALPEALALATALTEPSA
jgi:EAL and modified HD-GYP domain-containing signal transduction protein